MNNILNLIKDYIIQNKYIYLWYAIITIVFYGINFMFFSDSIDLPVDNILISIYIIFSPGLIAVMTIYRSRVLLIFSNATYYYNVVIHALVVLLFNFIALSIYNYFRVNKGGYWEDNMWVTLLISIPIILIGMIIAFEAKLRFEYLKYKIIFLFIAFIVWYTLDLLLNHYETRYIVYGVNSMYFIVAPLFLILYWYRKRLVKM